MKEVRYFEVSDHAFWVTSVFYGYAIAVLVVDGSDLEIGNVSPFSFGTLVYLATHDTKAVKMPEYSRLLFLCYW